MNFLIFITNPTLKRYAINRTFNNLEQAREFIINECLNTPYTISDFRIFVEFPVVKENKKIKGEN